jgi:hypothetical protein
MKYSRFRILAATLALTAGWAALSAQQRATEQEQFWTSLQSLCGKAFAGRAVEAPEGNTTYAGKRLVMHVRKCEPDVVQIPFHVGENRSRTWVVSRTDTGLRLRHDHRHEDGTEDKNTQYGGDTTGAGTALLQEFPVSTPTSTPAAALNVWSIELLPGRTFAYGLKRKEGPDRRFRIEFDLSKTVDPPPPAWGHQD